MIKETEYKTIRHTFEPIYDKDSCILILGSLPSVKSRENNFYYGHPQNRFWKVIAAVVDREVPQSIDEKKEMLHENHIAIWDVVAQCDIIGSSDASIKNVLPNDISKVLKNSRVDKIYANGAKTANLYNKYCYGFTNIPITKLPSTSPANAGRKLDRLILDWSVINCK